MVDRHDTLPPESSPPTVRPTDLEHARNHGELKSSRPEGIARPDLDAAAYSFDERMKRIVEAAVQPAIERIDRAMAQLRWTWVALSIISISIIVLYTQFFSLSTRTGQLERRMDRYDEARP